MGALIMGNALGWNAIGDCDCAPKYRQIFNFLISVPILPEPSWFFKY